MSQEPDITLHTTKRGLIRGASFLCALMLTLGAGAAVNYSHARQYRILLEDSYAASLSTLSTSLSGISSALQKGRYAASPTQISYLAASLWKDASAAKSALGCLPVGELHLDHTNEYLSQVGDYAMALSRKSVAGAEISRREREEFSQLYRYGLTLADQVNTLENDITQNAVTMETIKDEIVQMNTAGAQPQGSDTNTADAFAALEESFSGYPELVYDGPFSTHIAKRSPAMLEETGMTTPEAALQRAADAADVEPTTLQRGDDEHSPLACYTFYGEDTWIGVTQQGGHIVYVMRSRLPQQQTIEPYEAIELAREYARFAGYPGTQPTFYEISGNVCTISLVAMQGDVVLYPDLIKVDIAMDNGEVLGFDARGYLYNHMQRPLMTPALAAEGAQASISDALTPERTRLAVIPTAGQNEVYCWEVSAISEEGERVLVYINANTGVEEQILLLPAGGAASALL